LHESLKKKKKPEQIKTIMAAK